MALPYVLLAFFPALAQLLPQPGPWMVRLKQVLAFPLYATVIWLAWVLGAQLDNDAVLRLAAVLLLVALALWALADDAQRRRARLGHWRRSPASPPRIVVGVAARERNRRQRTPPSRRRRPRPRARGRTTRRSASRQLTDAGRPVFVDFTAAWCVTCQVNKRLVLNTDAVQRRFARARRRAAARRLDAPRSRDQRARWPRLAASGVPVYVLYRPGREPLILPEVLQPEYDHSKRWRRVGPAPLVTEAR